MIPTGDNCIFFKLAIVFTQRKNIHMFGNRIACSTKNCTNVPRRKK